MRFKDKLQIIKYMIIPVFGILFMLLYIQMASADVVYSDYFRLINEYLPDVTDASKFLVPDILTRIPATFLARLINVTTFGYSVTFDRLLSVIGLIMMAGCIGIYTYQKEIDIKWQIAIYIVLFSLNKWEILLNGTAWAHVVSFGFFFIYYMLFDLVWTGESSSMQEFVICGMPFFMLLFAGEYIVSFACTITLVCILGLLTGGANSWARDRERTLFVHVLITSIAALLLYIISRHFAVWEHSGATELGLFDVITQEPWYIPRFFIKTFAGAVIGQETIQSFFTNGAALPDTAVLLVGLLVIAAYILAFILYFTSDMLEHSILPLILMISGIGNHALVTIARWIFLNENYALSSRYSGQFMIGIIGILLVFSMYGRHRRSVRRVGASKRLAVKVFAVCVTVFIVLGNCYTTYQEMKKAVYREANYERMTEVILDYENYPEEELLSLLEWHKDPALLYSALGILKDNKLNVFSRPHFEE